ncbi:MAG: DUF523 domain-containing protein [Acidimicrobiales bacterium]
MPEGTVRRRAILVSACLLGLRCNHAGGSSPSAAAARLAADYDLVPVCPEVAGGLPTPRPAVELQPDGTVRTAEGDDVTPFYRRGADMAVAAARAAGATAAVLKARSPSCGADQVYDGTFTRARRPGPGVTARALRAAGIDVRSDEDLDAHRLEEPVPPPPPASANMGEPGA